MAPIPNIRFREFRWGNRISHSRVSAAYLWFWWSVRRSRMRFLTVKCSAMGTIVKLGAESGIEKNRALREEDID